MKISAPIPDMLLPEATRLWSGAFGFHARKIRVRPENAIAVSSEAGIEGVVGLRDNSGSFLSAPPAMSRFLYRAAPPTSDLVLDGIVVRRSRQGYGRALIHAASAEARQRHRPGLRAEVALRNHAALSFYLRLGFAEETRGWYGWPWSGRIVVMRKPV